MLSNYSRHKLCFHCVLGILYRSRDDSISALRLEQLEALFEHAECEAGSGDELIPLHVHDEDDDGDDDAGEEEEEEEDDEDIGDE